MWGITDGSLIDITKDYKVFDQMKEFKKNQERYVMHPFLRSKVNSEIV